MKNFKKLNTMKAEKGKGVETAKKHKKYVKDKLETAKGYIEEMTGISSKKDLLEAALTTNPVTVGIRAIKSVLDKNKKSKDTQNFKRSPGTEANPVPFPDLESEPSDRIIKSKRKDDDTGKAPPKFFKGGSILVKTKLGRTKPTKIY
mgnify:CR=1 FL=1|jgi:hypothetical protein